MPATPRKLSGYLLFFAILAVLLVNELRQGEITEILARISPFAAPLSVQPSVNSDAARPPPVVVEDHSHMVAETELPSIAASQVVQPSVKDPSTMPTGEVASDAGSNAPDEFESAGADGGRTRGAETGSSGGGGFGGGGFGGAGGFGGVAAGSGGDEGLGSFFFVSNDNLNKSLPGGVPPSLAVGDPSPAGTGSMPDVTSNPFSGVGSNGNDLKPRGLDSLDDELSGGGDDSKQKPPVQWHAVPDNTTMLGSIALAALCLVGLRRRIMP